MKQIKAIEEYCDRDGWLAERIIDAWEDEEGKIWVERQEWNSDHWEWIERNDLRKVEG